MKLHNTALVALATLALGSLTACSQQEIENSLQKGIQKGSDFVAERAAVTAAETLRGTLISKASQAGVSPENIELVAKVASSLPGVQITIVDANKDGLDDDGRITVSSLGAVACLTLPNLSSRGSAVAGAC